MFLITRLSPSKDAENEWGLDEQDEVDYQDAEEG